MSSERKPKTSSKPTAAKRAPIARNDRKKDRFVAAPTESRDKLFLRIAAPDGNRLQILHNLKNGLSFDSIDTLADAYDTPRKHIASVLSITASTLNRRKKEGRLQPTESDRVARLARLKDAAVDMMNGDNDAAIQWLKTPLAILGGETPLEHASSELGAREVEDLILRIQHGVFS